MKKLALAFAAATALATGAEAADLGAPRTPIAAAVVSPAFSWTGFYLGANIGYGFGNSTGITLANARAPANTKGPLGGLQGGFNYQINSLVLGVEANIALAGVQGTSAAIPSIYRTNALGALKGRVGFAVDRSLFYVAGGLGFQSASFATPNGPGAQNYSRIGWTLGAGYEYAITQNWTARLEYNYYDFGTRTLVAPYAGRVRSNVSTVTLGVNYLFSTGPAAVVARY